MAEEYRVGIVCTDKGQHPRVRLTMARREPDGSHGMTYAFRNFAPPMSDAEPQTAVGRNSYVFRCPSCPRMPQVEATRWWEIIDRLAAAGLKELDISLLP
ncbi:hypothetical protein [Streptomyces goshikiensis]|uniref:hypothetical protein n=1 Tax=Streptomyces goshikiensis TaxID=1942 RepID=UPI0036FA2BA9